MNLRNAFKGFDFVGFSINILFNTALVAIGINLIDNPVSFCLLNALFIWADIHSYNRGLNNGRNIVLDRINTVIKERYGIE